jgi:hypothetical protein
MTPTLGLTDDELPSIFIDSDQASQSAQRAYLRLIKADIGFVLVAAVLGAFAPTLAEARVALAYLIVAAFSGSLLASVVLANRRYDRLWYGGRALAESVKTLAWRFSTRAEPYNTEDGASTERFVADLEQVLAQKKALGIVPLGETTTVSGQITGAMSRLRAANVDTRTATYLSDRIANQRSWYRRRAKRSGTLERRWFGALIAIQACGLLAGFALITWPQAPVNGAGLFAALAAAVVAWAQINRHQELAQSYAIAENDLTLARERANAVKTDDELSEFVGDAEAAISREHTLWLARRDT